MYARYVVSVKRYSPPMRLLLALPLAAAAVLSSFAAPATAIVPCQTGDVGCYQTCYLPHYEKGRGVYWVYC